MLGSDIAKSGFEQEDAFKNSFNSNSDFKKQICDFIKMPLSSVAVKIPGIAQSGYIVSPSGLDYNVRLLSGQMETYKSWEIVPEPNVGNVMHPTSQPTTKKT